MRRSQEVEMGGTTFDGADEQHLGSGLQRFLAVSERIDASSAPSGRDWRRDELHRVGA
jgi:hypothetical protein